MSSIITANINALLRAKGMSMRALSRKTGLAPSSLSKVINGISTPREENLELIAKALEVTARELCSGALDCTQGEFSAVAHRPIPVLSVEQIKQIWEHPESRTSIKPSAWIAETAFSDLAGAPLVAIHCEGIAMEPVFEDGDLLYVQGVPFTDENATPKPRDAGYVLALAEGVERPVVRVFVRGDVGGDWLLAENTRYPGEQKLKAEKILGVIVAKACRYG